jgi:hypothetical protein
LGTPNIQHSTPNAEVGTPKAFFTTKYTKHTKGEIQPQKSAENTEKNVSEKIGALTGEIRFFSLCSLRSLRLNISVSFGLATRCELGQLAVRGTPCEGTRPAKKG